jgi:hypothetical protein
MKNSAYLLHIWTGITINQHHSDDHQLPQVPLIGLWIDEHLKNRWTFEDDLLSSAFSKWSSKISRFEVWRKNTNKRERMEAHCVLYADYFVDVSTYIPKVFWRWYRMTRSCSQSWFVRWLLCAEESLHRNMGFSYISKWATAMRLLPYGAYADTTTNDYLRIGDSTTRASNKTDTI